MTRLRPTGYAGRSGVKLIEVSPGVWRVDRPRHGVPRSDLPLPNVISDIMDPVEQVDGKFYESKRAFRAVGRALGLTEVGTEKLKPKPKGTGHADKSQQEARRQALSKAFEQYRAGRRTEV